MWYAADGLHGAASHMVLRSESKDALIRRIEELSRALAAERLSKISEEASHAFVQAAPSPNVGHTIGHFSAHYSRVLRRDMKAWWQEVVLSGGAGDGMEENRAIVCGKQLVGRTLNIFPHHSVALLATDSRFRIVAHAKDDARPLVYEGLSQTGLGVPVGLISHVPLDMVASKERPLIIVTSSLSGTYPDGIFVGIVTGLRPSTNGVFQEGVVLLPSSLSAVREVAVLFPCQEDLEQGSQN
ncbi:MAG: hypothetical protein LBC42_01585 [Puniceicoccales bacterium]|nr:hypothetical protein [Puniceicoccales bacterium]